MNTQERPIYRILSVAGFFGPDDHLYKEGQMIYFDGEPNEDMEPLNESARVAMEKFFQKLEEAAKKIAAKAGVSYNGRPRTLDAAIELSTLAARRTSTVPGDGGIPIMGADKSKQGIIGSVDNLPIPETKAAKGRGGSLIVKDAGQSLSKLVNSQSLA